MAGKRTTSLVGCVVLGAVLTHAAFTPPAGAQTQTGGTRTVFASVVAKDGAPD